jgi:hypothetical protein
MTESQNNPVKSTEVIQPVPEPEHSVYLYESAGISERQGKVPAWLWMVVVLLAIWEFIIWSPIGMSREPRG